MSKTYTLINDHDGNDTIDIEADTLIDAAIDGFSQLGWSLTSEDSSASDYHAAKAAPELLAALKILLPVAARSIQGTTDGEPKLTQARAAIAKAEGRVS